MSYLPRRELLEALEALSQRPPTERSRFAVVGRIPHQVRVAEEEAMHGARDYIRDLELVIARMMTEFAPRGIPVERFIADEIDRIHRRNRSRDFGGYDIEARRSFEHDQRLRNDLLQKQRTVSAAAMAAFDDATPEQKDRVVAALRTAGAPIPPQPAPPLPAPFTVDAPGAAVPQLQNHSTKGK